MLGTRRFQQHTIVWYRTKLRGFKDDGGEQRRILPTCERDAEAEQLRKVVIDFTADMVPAGY